jgi:surface antigen
VKSLSDLINLKKVRRDMRRTFRKKLVRNSLYALLSVILLVSGSIIVYKSSDNNKSSQTVEQINNNSSIINPLSGVSKVEIAYQVASMTGIYEIIAVSNQAQSQSVSQNVPLDDQLIAEPIILATSVKTRFDIVVHKVVTGDTLSSLAIKYGVTSQNIAQSNAISSANLTIGSTIYIPPVQGIVYVVKAGDTAASLASTYNANASSITSFNDAERTGLKVGERIVIPNGSISIQTLSYSTGISAGYYYGYGISAIYGSNGYDFGECTWYVALKRIQAGHPIPSNLGDAYSWYPIAQAEGLPTGLTPEPGAVIWFPRSGVSPLGHVGLVSSVNADGSITITEMNWNGWDVVDTRTIPASQLSQNRYIY